MTSAPAARARSPLPSVEHGAGACHAFRDRLPLVETGDDDGDARLRGAAALNAFALLDWKDVPRARLHRLRLPLPLHDWRGRTVVPEPRRTVGLLRSRGYLPHPPTVGARGRSGSAGGARPGRLAPDGLVRPRETPDPAAGALRTRRACPPAPAQEALRRRPHRLVPILLPPRGGSRRQARRLPASRRLARGLDARLLARVPRTNWGRDRLANPAGVPARAATRVLLLAAAREPTARARAAGETDAPRRAVPRTAGARGAGRGEAA